MDVSNKYLMWEDLTVVLPNLGDGATKKLLRGLSGFAIPGRIMAIMGPSGSGKSTLLDSLAGRLSASLIMSTGKVLINGKKSLDCKDIAYVTQEEVFLGTLTVRETLTYSAHLRLPTKMTKDDINEAVEKAIMEMGLQDCAENNIGNWHLRGISTGEKKRLGICLEILTHPRVLFLDEPTTGLDSASAFFVIRALKNIAYDGRIVVSAIHQPSSDVFQLFDDLFLLSGGEAVYFGERKMALKFFGDAGFPCPTMRNPSDHFLRCISVDFDNTTETLLRSQKNCGIPMSSDSSMNFTTAKIKEMIVEKYKQSEYSMSARRKIQEIVQSGEISTESDNKVCNASKWKQLCTLTRRSFLNMSRDMGYYWIRILLYNLISIAVGTIYFNIGITYWSILARKTCIVFVYGFMINLSIGGVPSFTDEMKVYYRERSNGHYGEAVYVLSNFFSSFPYLVATAISSGSIIYFLVKFNPEFSHYTYFCIGLFSYLAVTESCMMVIVALIPNILFGVLAGISVIGGMIVASDIFRPVPELPKIFWRYPMSYISFASWALEGQHKNNMIGLEFEPLVPGNPKLKGEIILQTMYGIKLNYSKWWDLAAVMVLILLYRILFFMVVKYKERASSALHRLSTKRTLRQLAKRPSFRREPFILSKRHQPLHPLSIQEGLTSPIS